MEELKEVNGGYKIRTNENCTEAVIECRNIIHVDDAIFTPEREYLIAVKNYYKKFLYYVDYLFVSEDFKLRQVLREDKGVNPQFIVAPDSYVWVHLSNTYLEKDGGIFLPMRERSRIKQPILKRDNGMDCFRFQNKWYGYVSDQWDSKKESKLITFHFDKNGLFKTMKQIKLDGIYNGTPLVSRGKCYISNTVEKDGSFYSNIYEIIETGELNFLCTTAVTSQYPYFIYAEDDESFCMATTNENKIESIRFSRQGQLIGRNLIYESDEEIFSINLSSSDDCSHMNFTSAANCGSIITDNGDFKVHVEPLSTQIRRVTKSHYLISSVKTNESSNALKLIKTGTKN